jgi:exopolysaccharide biosynthesis polyprenyl glycosylphosphotransferase
MTYFYSSFPATSRGNALAKRIFDLVFSGLVILLLLSWFMPLLALIIKLDSRGPVLFRQLRTGKDGKPFYCLKFRSMHINAESDHKQASRHDSRITRVGAILRKTSIDELPQFLNVLLGEMSVVGPRPHMIRHTEDYSKIIDNFMIRHAVTPGITGWAQVEGHRGETKERAAMERRVNADLFYIQNWSLALDLKIVALTVRQAIKGHENAF